MILAHFVFKRVGTGFCLPVAILTTLLFAAAQPAPAATETVLYSFAGPDGDAPNSTLILDSKGNLYGATAGGGDYKNGTVFEITAGGVESVLHSFNGGVDGFSPNSLIRDTKGNLYGTTYEGGTYGWGTVFELVYAKKTNTYSFKVLYQFTGGADGMLPVALIRDAKGNLYGATNQGGAGYGTVFEITAAGAFQVLYSFPWDPQGADYPITLTLGSNGNFYGTAAVGTYGNGAVFVLPASGTEQLLYSFGAHLSDGIGPSGSLLFWNGYLYGTTHNGGEYSDGTIFKVNAATGAEQVLYSFPTYSGDGTYPLSGLIQAKGNLYGTTSSGGDYEAGACRTWGCGTVFRLTKKGQETTLYAFTGQNGDGLTPQANLVMDKAGNLYGATYGGGAYGGGTVFKVTP